MGKLTKKQARELERILREAKAARDYVMSDSVAVARKETEATTTLHYTRKDGQALYEVSKEVGSPLCRIEDAIQHLTRFITENAR